MSGSVAATSGAAGGGAAIAFPELKFEKTKFSEFYYFENDICPSMRPSVYLSETNFQILSIAQ